MKGVITMKRCKNEATACIGNQLLSHYCIATRIVLGGGQPESF